MTFWPSLATRAATCSSKVDLPMPGSPPTSIAEPATIPPPIARSNSARPLGSRSGSAAGVSKPTSGITRPPPCRLCFAAKMLDTSALSWTSVFHSAQSGHWPCHRCWTDPQAWHVYRDLGFAIAEQYTNKFLAKELHQQQGRPALHRLICERHDRRFACPDRRPATRCVPHRDAVAAPR